MQRQDKNKLKSIPSYMPPFLLARLEIIEDFLREDTPRKNPKKLYYEQVENLWKLGLLLFGIGGIFTAFFGSIVHGAPPHDPLRKLLSIFVLLAIFGIVLFIIGIAVTKRVQHIISHGNLYNAAICNITPQKTRGNSGVYFDVEMEFLDEDKNIIRVKDAVSQQLANYLFTDSALKTIDVLYSPKYRKHGIIALNLILAPAQKSK